MKDLNYLLLNINLYNMNFIILDHIFSKNGKETDKCKIEKIKKKSCNRIDTKHVCIQIIGLNSTLQRILRSGLFFCWFNF